MTRRDVALKCMPVADVLLAPFVYPSAFLFWIIRRARVDRLPHCMNAMLRVGAFPIRDHYYDPQFDYRQTKRPAAPDRVLPGIDWNVGGQLGLLASMSYAKELADLPVSKPGPHEFYINNIAFDSGDAEFWYQLIRLKKPRRIFEVGSGNSTLMAMKAVRRNKEQDPGYTCKHLCIEPYEQPWLESTGITVLRRKVEDLPIDFFSELAENDILFIDSSHVIRPFGDVLFEYLEVLPTLNKGVIVHAHDIFSPRNYPKEWLEEQVKFWNEQYVLEAFLSHNRDWQVIGALNYLQHHHHDALKAVAPFLTPDREPVSFYIQKIA